MTIRARRAVSHVVEPVSGSETARSEIVAPERTGPVPEVEAEPSLLERWASLDVGASGDDVTSLQQHLVDSDLDHLMGRKPTDGDFGNGTAKAVRRHQELNGLEPTGRIDAETFASLTARRGPVYGDFQDVEAPAESVLAAGRETDLGKRIPDALDAHLATYERASQLTGVPVEMLAVLHGNESTFGTNPSAMGKEAGWGLDPRWTKTTWGREQITKVERLNGLEPGSLGTWNRKADTPEAMLRSAVVAAEHFKRNAALANVPVHAEMTGADIAGALGAWRAGPRAGKAAHESGKHHLYDPGIDHTPHAYHPGGTSVGTNGRHRVRAGVKEGSLRADVMLPLIAEARAARDHAP